MGYPGITLNDSPDKVEGFVFISDNLQAYWDSLDEFEGEGYQRTLTQAFLDDGQTVEVYVYALADA